MIQTGETILSLKDGEARAHIQLDSGFYLFEVEQRDSDVSAGLLDTRGRLLSRADQVSYGGSIEYLVTNSTPGVVELVVRGRKAARCSVSVTRLSQVSSQDILLFGLWATLDSQESAVLEHGLSTDLASLKLEEEVVTESSIPRALKSRIIKRLGDYQVRKSSTRESLHNLELARLLISEDGHAWENADLLNVLSRVLYREGLFERQESVSWMAIEQGTVSGNRSATAKAWNNLGVSFATRGLTSASIAAYQQALATREELGESATRSTSLHNLGVQLVEIGDFRAGIEVLEQAVELTSGLEGKKQRRLGQTLSALASAYAREGSIDRALATFETARVYLEEAGAFEDLAVNLEQQAQWLRHIGQLEEAQSALHLSLELSEPENWSDGPNIQLAYVRLGLGVLASKRGDLTTAQYLLAQSLETFDAAESFEGRVVARLELARLARSTNPRAALEYLEKGISLIESSRSNLRRISLRSTYLNSWGDLYEEAIDILAGLAVKEARSSQRGYRIQQAFMMAERARARALADRVRAPVERIAGSPAVTPGEFRPFEEVQSRRLRLELLKEGDLFAKGANPLIPKVSSICH